jgi:hypothetical protein
MLTDIYAKKHFLIAAAVIMLLAGIGIFAYILKMGETKKLFLPFTSTDVSYPAQILDLSSWKLTLPVTINNSNSNNSNDNDDEPLPQDIRQPELATYQMNPWFMPTPDKKGVVFRAAVNAPTTANSSYPRSELREMTSDGMNEAVWPSTNGTHTLFLDEAITAVPKNKPDVVAGQIHGDDDDLITIRLEGNKLFVARSRANLATLDDNYTLGKRFTIKFVAQNGKISVYYNGTVVPVYVLEKSVKQAYFKAGVYTQSNCETEESPDLCNENNFGEVVIYKVTVGHQQ